MERLRRLRAEKVHVRKGSDKIVGATLVAANAGVIISELTLAVGAGIGHDPGRDDPVLVGGGHAHIFSLKDPVRSAAPACSAPCSMRSLIVERWSLNNECQAHLP
jgi:hypothetical protein